jgi:hypothetical protein
MPDAINHLASYNRIAKAIEDKVTAITVAPANPAITVAPANPAITVAPANPAITVAPANPDLTPFVEAMKAIQINVTVQGGGSGSSSGLDCSCLDDAITKLTDKIDQMICAIAPGMAAMVQIQKGIIAIAKDGPQYGIDAPPGSFIFPDPKDSFPPLPYTPDPSTSTIEPITGALTEPPTGFILPPGGMQGATNQTAYNAYKCSMAYAIIGSVKDSYDLFGWVSTDSLVLSALSIPVLTKLVRWIGNLKSGITYAGTWFNGIQMPSYQSTVLGELIGPKWAFTINQLFYLDEVFLNFVLVIILELLTLGLEAYTICNQIIQFMDTHKDELACALYKARSIGEARDNFLTTFSKYAHTPFQGVLGQAGNGHTYIISNLLTDKLLTCLFACPADGDPALLPALGNCVNCIICQDTDHSIALAPLTNNPSIPGQAPSPATLPYNFGHIDADIICVEFSTSWVNGGGQLKIYIDGISKAGFGLGAEFKRGTHSFTGSFHGNLTITLGTAGTYGASIATIYSVSWREAAA